MNLPKGIAFDDTDDLYVANGGDGTIEEFDKNGVGAKFSRGADPKPDAQASGPRSDVIGGARSIWGLAFGPAAKS